MLLWRIQDKNSLELIWTRCRKWNVQGSFMYNLQDNIQCKSLCKNVRACCITLQAFKATDFCSFKRAKSELQVFFQTLFSKIDVKRRNVRKMYSSKYMLAMTLAYIIISYCVWIVLLHEKKRRSRMCRVSCWEESALSNDSLKFDVVFRVYKTTALAEREQRIWPSFRLDCFYIDANHCSRSFSRWYF